MEEAELEEKEAGLTLPGDDEISTCSDDDEDDANNDNKKESSDSEDDNNEEAKENTNKNNESNNNNQNSTADENEIDDLQVMIAVPPRADDEEENANDYFDGHNGGVDDFDFSNREYQIKKRNKNKFNKNNTNDDNDNDHEREEALLLRDQLGIGRPNNYYPAKKRSTRANNNSDNLDSFTNQTKQELEEDFLYSPQQHENYYGARKPRNKTNANNNFGQDDNEFSNENDQRNVKSNSVVAPEVDDFSYRRRPARPLFSSPKSSRTGRERKPRDAAIDTSRISATTVDVREEIDETTEDFFLPVATPNQNKNDNNKHHRRTLSAQERLNEVEEEADLDARVSRAGSNRSTGRRSSSNNNNHAVQLGDDDYTPRTASGMRARQLSLSMMDDEDDQNNNNISSRRSNRNNNKNSENSNNRSGRDVWNSLTRINVSDI